MAEAAWQVRAEHDSDIVRRLVARPLRFGSSGHSATVVELVVTSDTQSDEDEDVSDDFTRMHTEMVVLKAVLNAERQEAAHLRNRIKDVADQTPISDEARAVRDRWAALVDQLLHAPR